MLWMKKPMYREINNLSKFTQLVGLTRQIRISSPDFFSKAYVIQLLRQHHLHLDILCVLDIQNVRTETTIDLHAYLLHISVNAIVDSSVT